MHYIIFACGRKLDLGPQTLTMSDGNRDLHEMPCLVVREATREEWIEYHPEIVDIDFQLFGATHFYAVHVD